MRLGIIPAACIAFFCHAAVAGEADVTGAIAQRELRGTYKITVSVRHADTGWDHYADFWQVVAPDGTVLGKRVLLHPHEREQPFTRTLSGVRIPANVNYVIIRAHDKVHGFGGKEFRLEIKH